MTTTVPTAAPASVASDMSGCTLLHRALRSGTRMLAEAVDGIARDDVCDRNRQRGIAQFARAVLIEVGAHVESEDGALEELLRQAWSVLPVFARCASSGAPLLAPVLHDLADRVDAHLAGPARCPVRPRAGTSTARLLFLAPWLADQCHPAELRHVLAAADSRSRLLLTLGQKRYTARRDAVLG